MNQNLYCLLCVSGVAILVGGCPFTFMGRAYEEDLVNGYTVWATDVMEQAEIVKKHKENTSVTVVVPATVFAYGWNDDFIIAKRHPPKKDGKVDTSVIYWYIIEVASGNVHGPLSEGEFNSLGTELKVPAELSFKTIQ